MEESTTGVFVSICVGATTRLAVLISKSGDLLGLFILVFRISKPSMRVMFVLDSIILIHFEQ